MELMARLLACPSCRRHVQASELDCPFCGNRLAVGVATSVPARMSVLLLGLCLVGCTSGKDEAKKSEPEKTKVEPAPQPEPVPEVAPTTAVPPEPEPPPEPASTTAIEPPPLEGTDAGATIEDPPAVGEDAEPKVKYGGPRPQKKYGAPPKPPEGPGL
jgi:hypothetical protein